MSMRLERHHGQRVVRCFVDRPRHVDEMFRAAVARGAHRLALTCGDLQLTYGQLDDAVERLASGLAERGIIRGERIALLLGNHIAFVVAVLAAARLGVVSVPMNIRQRRPETQFVLNQCSASALIYDAALATELPDRQAMPTVRLLVRAGEGSAGDGGAVGFEDVASQAPVSQTPIDEDDTFCLLYTSGTTGRPKGAMLTHLGVIHSALHFEAALGLNERDVGGLIVPASHVTGLVAILLTMIRCGGRVAILPEFHAAEFLAFASRERMTYTLAVPAIYNLCLLQPDLAAYDLAAWRLGGFGGAPMPIATIERLATELPRLSLFNAYGATETTSPATILPVGDIATRPDSVGISVPCGEIVVVDDQGREVPAGETGELWIRGPNVVPGYWNNEEATADSFVGGYWISGDIGSVDARGYVQVFDRKKYVINRGGYKIYCIEVENELSSHPAIAECAVLGRPDPVLGEKVQAFVVTRPDAFATADELRSHCARSLSNYKVPEFISFLTERLPRNANGKVLKSSLRSAAGG